VELHPLLRKPGNLMGLRAVDLQLLGKVERDLRDPNAKDHRLMALQMKVF
jgi:hypothetical protein